MEHLNIFDSSIYGMTGIPSQLDSIVKFIINNRELRIPVPDIATILRTRVLSDTPISAIFNNALQIRKLEEIFVALKIPGGYATPEAITMSHITLDTLQLQDHSPNAYRAISTLPEYKNKIVLNLTPLLHVKTPTAVSDMNELQSIYVRGLLTRSYYLSKNWLTPMLIKYLSKSYSMTISTNIARTYDLTYFDQMTVATILTAYFQQMCYGDTREGEFPVTLADCDFLGKRFDILNVIEDMKEKLGGNTHLDIIKVCDLISKIGLSRIEKFNTRVFYTTCQRLGNDHISTLMSLEYPPYWAHQVLLALSGVKSGLFFSMKNQGKLVQEGKMFADILNRAQSFIPTV